MTKLDEGFIRGMIDRALVDAGVRSVAATSNPYAIEQEQWAGWIGGFWSEK